MPRHHILLSVVTRGESFALSLYKTTGVAYGYHPIPSDGYGGLTGVRAKVPSRRKVSKEFYTNRCPPAVTRQSLLASVSVD
jgi:hypothetical protein